MIHYLKSTTDNSHFNASQKLVTDNYSEWRLRLKLEINEFSFPAPEMENGKKAVNNINKLADFNDSEQIGWLSTYE